MYIIIYHLQLKKKRKLICNLTNRFDYINKKKHIKHSASFVVFESIMLLSDFMTSCTSTIWKLNSLIQCEHRELAIVLKNKYP